MKIICGMWLHNTHFELKMRFRVEIYDGNLDSNGIGMFLEQLTFFNNAWIIRLS